jgi:hypothetical protein
MANTEDKRLFLELLDKWQSGCKKGTDIEVSYKYGTFTYKDGNRTDSIRIKQDKLYQIIHTENINVNKEDFVVNGKYISMSFKNVINLLYKDIFTKYRGYIISLQNSDFASKNKVVKILELAGEPIFAEYYYKTLGEDSLHKRHNTVFKFDTEGGHNRWGLIANSSKVPNIMVEEFLKIFGKEEDGTSE